MKKKILLYALVVFGLALTSCTQKELDPNVVDLQADLDEISNLAQTGSWQISRFIDSGNDKTSNFTGYNFSFNADGSLIADSTSDNATGTWAVTPRLKVTDSLSNGGNDCDNCTISQLVNVLTGCSDWFVDKLERNDEDLEDGLSNYHFNFSSNGSLVATAGSNTYSGSWEITGSGNNISVSISVSGISRISDTWNLHEIELENGQSKVDLRIGGDDRLRFENACTQMNNSTSNSDSSGIDFNIFFANPVNFAELSADWDIVTRTDHKIELIHTSNGDTNLLTFENN